MNKLHLYSLISLLVLIISSCEYNVANEEEQVVDGLCETEVSYSQIIRPLMNTNCMPCHNGDGNTPFAPDLTTYTFVENLDVLIKEVTQSRRMPKTGSLTDVEIQSIKCWVDNGSLNN